MGAEKVKLIETLSDRQLHSKQLLNDLKALQYMLDHNLFESGITRMGAEQELCFIDSLHRPAPVLMEVLKDIDDDHFTTEFAKFNMEINLDPLELEGKCFSEMEKRLDDFLKKGAENAARQGARILLTGILPTIRFSDIRLENLTPLKRYHSLAEKLHELRGGHFEFFIEGPDSLMLNDGFALFEGSNTSFQVHYQVNPEEFASIYNWSMAITGPLMAATTNSPFLLGKRLWRETRIALFQQSVDTRNTSELHRDRTPRVCFGTGWVKNSVLEVYKDDIARHPSILASTRYEDAMEKLQNGELPHLYALGVFNGTVYKWNRPCFGVNDGKAHLRIEQRVMPAGPTIKDEIANAAFWIGMMHGLPEKYKNLSERMDFDYAKENFFKAARHGLGSYFMWHDGNSHKRIPATDLILNELLPIARKGLERAGINEKDRTDYLDIIEQRVKSGRTGSQWQLSSYNKIKNMATKDEALVAMTGAMAKRQAGNKPVHEWKLADISDAGSWLNRYKVIEQLMSTDIFTVNEEDPLDLAANVMDWRNIRHLPVENAQGELVGILNCKLLSRFYSHDSNHPVKASVGMVMEKDFPTVSPETETAKAIPLLKNNSLGCLPVVRKGKMIGLVTEKDFLQVTENLFAEINETLFKNNS
ncbi:MAG: CBS domain-containing protein [Saprospiraceae bacterium]